MNHCYGESAPCAVERSPTPQELHRNFAGWSSKARRALAALDGQLRVVTDVTRLADTATRRTRALRTLLRTHVEHRVSATGTDRGSGHPAPLPLPYDHPPDPASDQHAGAAHAGHHPPQPADPQPTDQAIRRRPRAPPPDHPPTPPAGDPGRHPQRRRQPHPAPPSWTAGLPRNPALGAPGQFPADPPDHAINGTHHGDRIVHRGRPHPGQSPDQDGPGSVNNLT